MSIIARVVVLDRIEPGELPPYCIHGRAQCCVTSCDAWVWLGSETHEIVASGEAVPMCKQCAARWIPRSQERITRVRDHLRAEGPHE